MRNRREVALVAEHPGSSRIWSIERPNSELARARTGFSAVEPHRARYASEGDHVRSDCENPGEEDMKVSSAMTTEVVVTRPDQTIQEAAGLMLAHDLGILPVADDDRLVGMITDRDIAVRAVAHGKDVKTPIRDAMTSEIKYCFDDEDTDHVVRNMGEQQLRRLPVVDRDKRLVGILSLADLASDDSSENAGDALARIVEPGGKHSQTRVAAA